MTPEQFKQIMEKLEEIKDEAGYKGHFLIIILLLAIASALR